MLEDKSTKDVSLMIMAGKARMFGRVEQLSGVGWRFCRDDKGVGEGQDYRIYSNKRPTSN